jgi:hypothetical protein
MFCVLLVSEILQGIGPEEITHRTKRWRLLEAVQLENKNQNLV